MSRAGQRSPRVTALSVVLLAAALVVFATSWLPTARRYYDLGQPVQTGALAPQYDFFQYYGAGHNWRLGLDPYRNHPGVPGAISIPRSERISGYIYPPAFLPVLGLLSRAGYDTARGLWLALELAALAGTLATAVALVRGRRLVTLAVGLFLIAASNPLLFHIRQGQIDVIVAGLALAGFLLYGRARSLPAALLLAAAILIKVTPVVLLLAMVAYYRDWRFLLKTLAAAVVLGGVSLIWVHPGLYGEYVTRVMPAVSEGNPFFHNQSLLRSWSHVSALLKFASLAAYAVAVALAAVVGPRRGAGSGVDDGGDGGRQVGLGAAAGAAGAAGRRLQTHDLQLLLVVVVTMLLFSPLTWRMAYVWAIVPATLVLAAAPWRGRRWQYALVVAGTALMSLPLWDRPVLDSLNMIGALVAGAGALAALIAARPAHTLPANRTPA